MKGSLMVRRVLALVSGFRFSLKLLLDYPIDFVGVAGQRQYHSVVTLCGRPSSRFLPKIQIIPKLFSDDHAKCALGVFLWPFSSHMNVYELEFANFSLMNAQTFPIQKAEQLDGVPGQ